jgi:Fe-S-cluster containining protein
MLGATMTDEDFDCRQCGACCRDASDGRVLVEPEDLVRWRREGRSDILGALVPGHFGLQAFASDANGTCVHHGTDGGANDCAIYETRAASCHMLVPGSRECLAARARFL